MYVSHVCILSDLICTGVFSFYSQQSSHEASNIVDFINSAVNISRAGYCLYYLRPRTSAHSPTPVRLLHPVLKRPPSLLELSRSVVQLQQQESPSAVAT